MSDVAVQATVYCLVPPELADEVLDVLRDHYAGEPTVAVIVDRRLRRRRSGADRRTLTLPPPPEVAARRSGRERRVRADRRAPVVPRRLTLPEQALPHAERLRWVQRLPAVSRGIEALSMPELVARIQAGDAEAPTEFYWRMFERVYSRLRTILGRYSRPDEHMVAVFGALLDRIDEWMPGGDRPFEDWLYEVVDTHAAALPRESAPENPRFGY